MATENTDFPTTLDNDTIFANYDCSDRDDGSGGKPSLSQFMTDAGAAIQALQAKVGADSSAVTTSHDYKIAQLEASGETADGWKEYSTAATFGSDSDPEFTFTISGVDATQIFRENTKLKLNQTTDKYFVVTKSAFSTNTTVTIYGGTDYNLANATIDSIEYSYDSNPDGFPLDPTKWEITASPADYLEQSTFGSWTSAGNIGLVIGNWNLGYKVRATIEAPNSTDTSLNYMQFGYDTTDPSSTTGSADEPWLGRVGYQDIFDGTKEVSIESATQIESPIRITSGRTIYFNGYVDNGSIRGRLRDIELFARYIFN